MIALIASVFALGIGPLVYQTIGPMKRTDKIVSGFILTVIAATLFIDVLPEAVTSIGYLALILAILGFVGPTLIEKLFSKSANKTHVLTTMLGILGLIIHASIDGAAIQTNQLSHQHENLSIAIILHRLPVGLTIWWLLRPLIGERFALLTLTLMAIATTGGYFLSMQLTETLSSNVLIALQAFISGSLLHVVFHKPHADGCMHTSQAHSSHQHSKKLTPHPSSINNLVQKATAALPGQWEIIGMLLGIVVMLVLHFYF